MQTVALAPHPTLVYIEPTAGRVIGKRLIVVVGPDAGRAFTFYEDIEIGRLKPDSSRHPGTLYIDDPTISSRHCVISQDADGHCFVRDLSLNGTWLEGHRLVPGAEVEVNIGALISVGHTRVFRLEGAAAEARGIRERATEPLSAPIEVTVVIGDIRRYTALVGSTPPELLQPSVSALFQALEEVVATTGGTPKEYAGDAILAYWEPAGGEGCATRACRAALSLDVAARRLAKDPAVWRLPERPLSMDWALATGTVLIQRLGGSHPLGLSMVGEPVVKTYRLEKLADEDTGSIVVCERTRRLAGDAFRFRDLGERKLEGFPAAERIFALETGR